jgi:hypothetical protein
MNNELERIKKEAVTAKFKLLSYSWPGAAKEDYENLSKDRQYLGQDVNLGLPKWGQQC